MTTTTIAAKPASAPNGAITVNFQASAKNALWPRTTKSLLEFAEGQGLRPDFSCRAGICGSCATRLISGEVSYFEDPLDDPGAGKVLLCCTRPVSSVVLDLLGTGWRKNPHQ